MMRSYVSTVIPHSADAVWGMVKDFCEYRWGEGVGEARIENGFDPNTPGAIRCFDYYGRPSRQRLVAYSAQEQMQSWESVEPFDSTLSYYRAKASSLSTAYYSTVLDYPVETVWALIRDFNNYPTYIEGVTESVIEDGRRGDEVGAVRRFRYHDNWIRQRLGAHCDERRSLTYVGMDPFVYPAGHSHESPAPVRYEGTMHVLPIADGKRTFLEWSVAFDATRADIETWRSLLLTLIPEWSDSLRRTLIRSH